jgi:hypothetical protein
MSKPKTSRIERPRTTAPRAARKRKTVLADEAAAEIAVPLPAGVVEEPPPVALEVAPSPVALEVAPPLVALEVTPPPVIEAAPVPWTPPPAREAPRVPWFGLDGRRLARAVARRIGRELERRIPLLARVRGLLRAL